MSLGAYLSRHAQVFVGSLGRIVRQPFATFMTMGVIAVALALPLLLYLLLTNVRAATGSWNEAFDLSVYMAKGAPAGRTASVAKQLELRGDVASVRTVTADQAMAEFRKTSGFGQALDALTDNPLPDTLVVTPALGASTPDGTEALRRAITAIPDVQSVQLDTDWVKRLHALLDLLRRVLLLTAGILGIGVVLIVGNTIRLDILNRRAEIEVMKLVGATDRFARRPFLYSGVWYGLGGGLLALGLVGAAALSLAQPVDALARLYGSPFQLGQLPWSTDGAVLLAAVALAWLGSWLAATRHIRGIEPN
ncbi:MAG TPA: permease-like cell division protein FtsX [Steroidobacteraceae bacterium]|jgi:cell division transport system permease protein|nr:permease-like cell division protein FtsX [Steroidobacteraceae bacterium]